MNEDTGRRVVLCVAFALIICGLIFLYKNRPKTEGTKQAVTATQTASNKAQSAYLEQKDKNIQKTKEVAKNAVKKGFESYSSDGDVVAGWAELVARARRYNDSQR